MRFVFYRLTGEASSFLRNMQQALGLGCEEYRPPVSGAHVQIACGGTHVFVTAGSVKHMNKFILTHAQNRTARETPHSLLADQCGREYFPMDKAAAFRSTSSPRIYSLSICSHAEAFLIALDTGQLCIMNWTRQLFAHIWFKCKVKSKHKAFPVTGRWGLQGCEMLRIQHCVDNRLTDGGEVVTLMHRKRSTPQKHFSASGTHLLEAE
jgi:hypothetical protein